MADARRVATAEGLPRTPCVARALVRALCVVLAAFLLAAGGAGPVRAQTQDRPHDPSSDRGRAGTDADDDDDEPADEAEFAQERARRVRARRERPLPEVADGLPWAELGGFEWRMARHALEATERTPIVPAEGARVGEVLVVRIPVFIEEEPWPQWPNRFHALTRERVLRAGIAMEPGDAWSETRWRDTRRALMDPSLFSVVLVLPVAPPEGEREGEVDVIVVVRDVWSLRLNFFLGAAGALTNVQASLVETNLFGTNAALGIGYELRQGDWQMGPLYVTRRFARTRIAVYETLRFQVERGGGLEGVQQVLEVGEPFYDTTEPRAWRARVAWNNRMERRFVGDRLRVFTTDAVPDASVEEVWRERDLQVAGGMAWAWGRDHRRYVEPNFGVQWRRSSLPGEGEGLDPGVVSAFRDAVVPRDRRDVGPGIRVGWERNRFVGRTNLERFRMAEELRHGGWAEAQVSWWEPGVGSDVRGVGVQAEVGWQEPLGDDAHVTVVTDVTTRAETREGLVDQAVGGRFRVVSPSLWAGRWVAEVGGRRWFANGSVERLLLGADAGQRGYATGTFVATDHARWNVEWRSRSFEVLASWWGGAVFWDGLWLPAGGERAGVYGSVGAGVRFASPQAGTVVRGVDLGFPLRDGRPLVPGGWLGWLPVPILSIRLDQAF